MSEPLARWKDLCLDAVEPHRLGEFWAPVLGLHRDPAIPQAVTLVGSEPTQRVWVNLVDRPRTVKNRLHLDVYAASIDDLVALGATVLAPAEETGFGWTVMADPEGGEFCAFLREPAELPAYRLHGIGIDCVDAAAQAAWWGQVFGVTPTNDEGHDWHTLEHATPGPGAHPRLRAGARAAGRPQPGALGRDRRRRRPAGRGRHPALGHAGLGHRWPTPRATSSASSPTGRSDLTG